MRERGRNHRAAIAGIALIAAGLPMRAMAEKSVDETKATSPTGMVEIEVVSGTVVITGWNKGEVSVKGTIHDDARLEITGGGSRTSITVKGPETHGLFGTHGDIDCDLQIQVPLGSEIAAQTVSADLSVSGVKGEIELETVSGAINAAGEPSRASVKTVSGEIDFTASTPRVEAESVSGSVELRGPTGEVEASTVSGEIIVTAGRLREVQCSAVSGSVEVDAGPTPDAHWEISSHSGEVLVTFPADVSADVSVETFSGEISSDFGGESRRTSKYAPGEELEFTAGSGDARIEISSFSGTVRLRKK
jgi:DUF4097 and DUF4098 domain-containing protein YvlB